MAVLLTTLRQLHYIAQGFFLEFWGSPQGFEKGAGFPRQKENEERKADFEKKLQQEYPPISTTRMIRFCPGHFENGVQIVANKMTWPPVHPFQDRPKNACIFILRVEVCRSANLRSWDPTPSRADSFSRVCN